MFIQKKQMPNVSETTKRILQLREKEQGRKQSFDDVMHRSTTGRIEALPVSGKGSDRMSTLKTDKMNKLDQKRNASVGGGSSIHG